jgi:hypothetical protein
VRCESPCHCQVWGHRFRLPRLVRAILIKNKTELIRELRSAPERIRAARMRPKPNTCVVRFAVACCGELLYSPLP